MSGDVVALGFDVGKRQLHIVGLDDGGEVVLARVVAPEDVDVVLRDLSRDVWVAIDAPDEQRTPRHLDNEDLPRKFRSARCAEIALGRLGYWVPWATPPAGTEAPGWMETGFDVWQAAREYISRVVEVYPHAAFRVLGGGGSLPKKGTSTGTKRRVELLNRAGVHPNNLEMWAHDSLDAAVAAVVARDALGGVAREVRCSDADDIEHDDSSMWLPRSVEM